MARQQLKKEMPGIPDKDGTWKGSEIWIREKDGKVQRLGLGASRQFKAQIRAWNELVQSGGKLPSVPPQAVNEKWRLIKPEELKLWKELNEPLLLPVGVLATASASNASKMKKLEEEGAKREKALLARIQELESELQASGDNQKSLPLDDSMKGKGGKV